MWDTGSHTESDYFKLLLLEVVVQAAELWGAIFTKRTLWQLIKALYTSKYLGKPAQDQNNLSQS